MSKRIGISLLLALTILVSSLNYTNGFINSSTVYATPTCLTISECLDVASSARDNITEILNQENELNDEIAELNGEITVLRSDIENLELSIRGAQTEISHLQNEINNNRLLLQETEEEIEGLMGLVAQRMTISQRMDNSSMVIALLSESHDLNDFMSQVRFFSRVANTDAELMDQLGGLLDQYDVLIVALDNQVKEREEIQNNLKIEQAILESRQETLGVLEAELREELYDLGVERMTEEEALAIAEAARKVLESTPPPPILTSLSSDDSSSSESSHSGDLEPSHSGDLEPSDLSGSEPSHSSGSEPSHSTSTGSVVSSSSSRPGTNSGLSHPMPGAPVTSEFGPRELGSGFHWGIDVALPGRPSILAAASGTVTVNTWHDSLGWYMIIAHEINGQRVDTVYAHMESQSSISVATVVSQGQAIGIQGNTGFSTGPHLHFEVHPGGFQWNSGVNPREWINF